MERRRLKIDWGELEAALTWRDPESEYWLDLTSGEIMMWTRDGDRPSEEDIDDGVAGGRLIAIDPLPSSVEYGWMEEFAATVSDAGLRQDLEHALGGKRPFRRFKDVLCDRPAERARWFAFYGERVRAAARDWLDENGIEAFSSA
jgi:hypothetical protein